MTNKQPFDREIYDSIAKDALYLTRIRTILDRTLMRNAILLIKNSDSPDTEFRKNEYNKIMRQVKDINDKITALISEISSMEGAFDIFLEEMTAIKYNFPQNWDGNNE
jgi:hypothetical protein